MHHADAAPGDEQAERAADSREHEALGEHLANQLQASGAERRAHGNLAAPAREPRQDQVGDVGADDQQQEADRGRNQQQRRPHGGDELFLRRDDAGAPSGVAVRIGRREPAGDHRHLALRLLLRDAIGEAADDVERSRFARSAVRVVRIEAEWRPDVDVRAGRKVELPPASRRSTMYGCASS